MSDQRWTDKATASADSDEPEVVLLDSEENPAAKAQVQPYRVPFWRHLWAILRFGLLRLWRLVLRQHPMRWREYRRIALDDEAAQVLALRRRSETAWMQSPGEEGLDAATLEIAKALKKTIERQVLRTTRRYEKDSLKGQHEIFRLQLALARAKQEAEEKEAAGLRKANSSL